MCIEFSAKQQPTNHVSFTTIKNLFLILNTTKIPKLLTYSQNCQISYKIIKSFISYPKIKALLPNRFKFLLYIKLFFEQIYFQSLLQGKCLEIKLYQQTAKGCCHILEVKHFNKKNPIESFVKFLVSNSFQMTC